MSAGQPPLDSPEIRRLTPVLGPGYTYGSVTDKISAIVLTRPTSLGWFVGFAIAFSLMGLMTLFAVACAGIFPLIHAGRPWMAFYMFPYPSNMGIWPEVRSPISWDVF